jgi:macrolide-specific efflux system membrane fusion protein
MYQSPISPPATPDAGPEEQRGAGAAPGKRRPFGRRIGLVALILAAALGAWWYFSQAEAPLTRPPSVVVGRGDIEVSVLANGLLKPSKLVAVGSQASGRITTLPVAVGQVVKAGDLIATIDSTRQENDLKTSEATLAQMRAQLVEKEATLLNQRKTLERQRTLATRNTIAASDLDSAEADVAVTEAQIEATKAQIEAARVAVSSARVNLGYTRITAPMDGTVLAVVAQEGQTVNATQSAPTIVVLGDLSTMMIHAEISEADVIHTTPGQSVWFTILGDPATPHGATLTSIAPAPDSIVNDQSLTGESSDASSEAIYYNGVFTVPNPDGELRTYMTAQVRIVLDSVHDVLTVPASALGPTGADGKTEVSVLAADGTSETRRVEIGLNDRGTAEVRSGLAEGERLLIGGGVTLSSDQTAGAARRQAARMPPPMGL